MDSATYSEAWDRLRLEGYGPTAATGLLVSAEDKGFESDGGTSVEYLPAIDRFCVVCS
jgi:hypothetical protein